MTDSTPSEARRLAEHARELAEQAADDLEDTRFTAEKAADEDVEERTGDVDPHPSDRPAIDSELNEPGAPMT